MKGLKEQMYHGGRISALIFVAVLVAGLMLPDTQARADDLFISLSTKTVRVGEELSVTVSVPAGVSATVNLSYSSDLLTFRSASSDASANAGTVSMTIGDYSSNSRSTGTFRFQASSAGKAELAASSTRAGNRDGDQVSIGGASTIVEVQGSGEADNALSSLSIGEGTISPAFQPDVYTYTAEVGNDVTSVTVSAKTRDSGATVESVQGDKKLAVGENDVHIVVKAKNGETAEYLIKVTRKEEGESVSDSAENGVPENQWYEMDGMKLYPSDEVPANIVPKDFIREEITLWDKTYPFFYNETIGSQLGLVYLVDENGEKGAVYLIATEDPYKAYPFVCLNSEYGYIIVIPDGDQKTLPKGYQQEDLSIEGKGTVHAYSSEALPDVYMIYAINSQGGYGWYQYDAKERTYMRYYEQTAVKADQEQTVDPEDASISRDLKKLKSENRMILWAFFVVVLVLVVVIVLLILRKDGKGDSGGKEALIPEGEDGNSPGPKEEESWPQAEQNIPEKGEEPEETQKPQAQEKQEKPEEIDWNDMEITPEDDWDIPVTENPKNPVSDGKMPQESAVREQMPKEAAAREKTKENPAVSEKTKEKPAVSEKTEGKPEAREKTEGHFRRRKTHKDTETEKKKPDNKDHSDSDDELEFIDL